MDVLKELQNVLQEYTEEVEGIESAFISTLDGNMIVEFNKSQVSIENLTPIAGSMLGLAESVSNIINNQKLHQNITIMDDNILGFFKVNDTEDTLFLGVICDRITSLSKVLHLAKKTIDEINLTLSKVS